MPGITLSEAAAPLILSLDLGSSSSRALIFDARARFVTGLEAHAVHALHVQADGTAEDDAAASFARAVELIDRVIKLAAGRAGDIGAVAIDTYAANLVGVDAAGQPLTPIYTYADTRAAEDAAQLRRQFDEEAVLDRTGCLLRASYLPARFAWLQRTQPQMLQRVKRWLSLGEFIFDRLFDHTVVSTSIASWGGLLNRRTPQWDDDWFKQLPVSSDQFSSLVDASKSLRGLKSEWASRWPMLKAVPWFPAVGDGAAANLGSGCSSADRLALTIGTSGALRLALPGTPESIPFGLWCYRIDHDTSLLGGATNEGGNVYAWLRQTLQLTPDDQFGQAIAAIAPDSHGLTALPFLAGERSPGYVGGARAAIDGLSISTRPIEIARALLEAIAYRFAIIQRRIAAAYPSSASGKIIASGGGLLSQPAWLQIFADVLNQPVIASAEKEATSRGAALLALRSIGAIQSFDEAPADLGPMFAPDPDRHTIYLKAIERQQQLYDVLVKSEA